jgi:hypothetical protein
MVGNRDERRTRPHAAAPRVHRGATTTSLWPVDPVGGGTWVAVNDAGLALALLNRGSRHQSWRTLPAASRGTIIPRIADAVSLAGAIERALALDVERLDPFTLVMVQATSVAALTSGNGGVALRIQALTAPVLFTSSSLGDDLVATPRRELFSALVTANPAPLEGQAEFHHHQWPSRPEISVRMSRADAATVSRTVVDVTPRAVTIRYTPLHQ